MLRYLLVRESGEWRVDDIVPAKKDAWPVSKVIAGH